MSSRLHKRQSRVVGDATALVTLSDMKDAMLEYNNDRDDTITALIASCTADLQTALGFYIDTTGLITQYYDRFDSRMYIFHPFVKEADLAVEYLNDSYEWTAVSSSVYRKALESMPPMIILKSDQTWPTPVDEPISVRIKFKADTSNVAWNSFKQCIMEMVAEAYENPEGSWHSASMESRMTRVVETYRLRS